MEYRNLITTIDNDTLTIILDRPKQLNALNKETLNELHHVFNAALPDRSIKGVILTGQGHKAFVAGADIKEFADFTPMEGRDMAREGQTKVFNLIQDFPKPIVAAVNGYALGGGLELALACHFRIAVPSARLGLPEVSLGLIPGYGGTQRLPQLIGRGRALELILTSAQLDARTALSYGLINAIAEPEELLTTAFALLSRIYSQSPHAVGLAIQAINAADRGDLNGFETEINAFSECFGTADFKEGVNAFLEKRKPNF